MYNIKYLIKRSLKMDYKNMFQIINNIHKKTGKSRINIFNDMKNCALNYGAGYCDYDLFEMYNLNAEQRQTFITRGRNNELIKKYNDPEYNHFFRNKIDFNTTFKKYIKRDFISVKDSDIDSLKNFMKKHSTFMAKPVEGTCGKGIEKINTKDYKNLDEVMSYLKQSKLNYVLEEVISQCEDVNKIYDKCINTVRIVTILDNTNIPHIICAYFRIGNGKYVDNFNSGGLVAPIDEQKGIVTKEAIDKNKTVYEHHPITNTLIKGFKFPDWDKAIKLVKEASKLIPKIRYVGWDVCFSTKGPIIVEGNEYPGHDIYQLPIHTPSKVGIWPKFTKAINESIKC